MKTGRLWQGHSGLEGITFMFASGTVRETSGLHHARAWNREIS